MDDCIDQLRFRLHALTRGKAPTGIRYPAAVRAEVVGLANEARAAGASLGRLAAGLGLPRRTIVRWQRHVPHRALRQVRIESEPVSPPARPALVLVTPQGWRIEGLDLATLLRLLQGRG